MPLPDLQNLQLPFQMNAQSAQVVAVLSPTSPQYWHSIEVIQDIFAQTPTPDLKGHIVWAPMLLSDTPQAAYEQSAHLRDRRLHHYWDTHKVLSAFFSTLLGLTTSPIGNIYLVFAPCTAWQAEAGPRPTFWMHQPSSGNQSRSLNLASFKQAIRAALERASQVEDCTDYYEYGRGEVYLSTK